LSICHLLNFSSGRKYRITRYLETFDVVAASVVVMTERPFVAAIACAILNGSERTITNIISQNILIYNRSLSSTAEAALLLLLLLLISVVAFCYYT